MPTIKTTIDIAASAEMVWRVLTDFPSYPKWNPVLREVLGRPEKGQRLKIRQRLTPERLKKFSTRVVRAIPASELHWRVSRFLDGLFDDQHSFIIVPNGVKGVRLIQRRRFSGLLAPFIVPVIGRQTKAALELMNAALKKVAEGKH